MKKFLGLLKDIFGWFFLMLMVVVSFSALVIVIVKRHRMIETSGIIIALSAFVAIVALICLFLWWMCRAYGKRSTAITFCGLAVLTLMFYAEEDLRGWYAFKEHNGAEKIDYVSIMPPPVPQGQNFAMTPLVSTCYAEMLDSEGHELIPRKRNVQNRLWTRIYVDNYEGNWLNTGSWAKGTMTDLNLWQNYYRKLSARTNLFPVSLSPQSAAKNVVLALSKYDSTVDELREASRLPYSRFPLNYDTPNPAAILLPHLATLKSCSQLLSLRASAELQDNQSEKAFSDIDLALQLADKVRSEPILISHLVRVAMLQLTIQPIWEGLAGNRWSEAQLMSLGEKLSKLDFLTDYDHVMEGERCFDCKIIEFIRHSENPLNEINVMLGDDARSVMRFEVIALILGPSGWYDQNKVEILDYYQKWGFHVTDRQTRTFSPLVIECAERAVAAQVHSRNPCSVIGRMMLPSLGKTTRRFAYAQSSVDLARIAIALERYRLANGEFPDSLNLLTSLFNGTIPNDVIGGQPLHYRRTDNGQFTLYSNGWNEKDDGGTVGLLKGSKSVDIASGDWVWQYPEK